MMKVRTRFAPSPTGFQHIGGFRTALYAWLMARHHSGSFILRIEDTDQERRVPGAVRYLIESLQWLGVDVDEGPSHRELKKIDEYWDGAPDYGGEHGPYIQSLRAARYHEVAEELVARGICYRCDCTAERLEQERQEQMQNKVDVGYSGYCRGRSVGRDVPHVVRFKMPAHVSLTLMDVVRGKVTWEAPALKDPVLLKSDGLPTYHLACVVDDHDMKISHVMRGEEWLSTAPLHILLYQALDWQIPIFCHLSQVLGADGKKLSKRHGAESLDKFREQGYLPQALVNYVVHVGWNPGAGEEQEIFTKDELIERFSLEGLSKAGGVFDMTKLQWMNGVYIRNLAPDAFQKLAAEQVRSRGWNFDADRFGGIAALVQERTKLLPDIIEHAGFLYTEPADHDLGSVLKKGMDKPKALEVLDRCLAEYEAAAEFSVAALEEHARVLAEALQLKLGPVCMVLRVAITGKAVSLPLFESLAALGREAVLKRLAALRAVLAK